MRAATQPVRTPLRRLRPLLALLALALPACGAPPPEVDLVGRVESASGMAMSGVLVHAGDTLTTAATDGSFDIEGVPIPYTLTVASTAGDGWVHAFAGLTTATPVVVPLRQEMPLVQATISGDVWNGNPVPAGHRVSICVEGVDFTVWGCEFADAGETSYSLQVSWSGATAANVRVHALYVAIDGEERPTGYAGARQLAASVTSGGTTTVDLGPLLMIGTPPLVPITIDAGNGTVVVAIVAVRMGDRLLQPIYRGAWPGGSVDGRLPPALMADTYQVTAWVQFPSGSMGFAWSVADSGAATDLVVPPPPNLLGPASGAFDVTPATVFRAADTGATARVFDWSPTGTTVGPDVLLTTAATTASLPDVGVVGLSYPAGGTYDWRVLSLDAPGFAAAVATRFDYYGLAGFGGAGQVTSGAIVTSESRDLTLAP